MVRLKSVYYINFTSGFMKKHCVMHWKAMRTRNVNVTVNSSRVKCASDFRAFSLPEEPRLASICLFIFVTRWMINMLREKMEPQGTSTSTIQWTQNS